MPERLWNSNNAGSPDNLMIISGLRRKRLLNEKRFSNKYNSS